MAKKLLLLILVSLIARSIFWLGANVPSALSANLTVRTPESCIQPRGKAEQACRELEKHILAATVRMELVSWIVSDDESGYELDSIVGHATIKEGRYLVTHNHFRIPLSIRHRDGEPEVYVVVKLSNSSGKLLFEGPLSDFELVWEDPEALVITPKEDGLLEKLGFVSAEFSDWPTVPLEAGMEVAQVDWDGATTRVDWVTVQEVKVEDGVPRLVLADDVTPGASGGGIFWRGVHIANNWAMVQQFEGSGALVNTVTKVALNSAQIAGEAGQTLPFG